MGSELIYATIILCIFLSFSMYWFVIFIIKIAKARRYKKATERRIIYDKTDYISEQYNYHYQTEICKYSMLLVISLAEISAAVIAYIHLPLEDYITTMDTSNIYRYQLKRCAIVNSSIILNFQYVQSSFVPLAVLRAIGKFVEMLVPVLVTCLMSYLISRMKKSYHINIRRYICVICMIGIFDIITSYYTFLMPLGKLAYLVTFIYNYILFLIYVKKFKQSLLQAAMERLVQYGDNRIEMKQYKYFCYSINCICVSFSFAIIGTILTIIAQNMIFFIFFGKCVFPTAFMPELINSESRRNMGVSKIFSIFYDIYEVSCVLAFIGLLISSIPLVFITIGIWMRSAARIIRQQSRLQYRYQGFSACIDNNEQVEFLY